jgi:hypothetical protein
MAGFAVSINGGIWVSTEAGAGACIEKEFSEALDVAEPGGILPGGTVSD